MSSSAKPTLNVIVEIKGGALWAVRLLDVGVDDPDVQVTLVDHDNIQCGDPNPLEGVAQERLTAVY